MQLNHKEGASMQKIWGSIVVFVMPASVFLLLSLYSNGGNVWASDLTFAACRTWIQANHRIDYPDHGCAQQADVLNTVKKVGGGVIPIGPNRFFIVWLPEDWDKQPNRKLVVALHGNGGCAERMFKFWNTMSSQQTYAIVALQYAEEDSSGGLHFDDSPRIYEHLRTTLSQLREHCPVADIPVVLHGFSRGSARTFELAVMDRAATGMKAFSAFISDSGTVFPEYQGNFSPFLQDVEADAYNGAHFWLYCGGNDHRGRTCQGLKKMQRFVLAHGGTVDEFYKYPPGGHGIFITGRPQRPGRALTALFDYIDKLENR
jgi:predicted esterase